MSDIKFYKTEGKYGFLSNFSRSPIFLDNRFWPTVEHYLRPHWANVREEVMLKAIRAKFYQNPELKILLLETENHLLIEDTENDNFWANGVDGTGKNKLGIILMTVREELKKYPLEKNAVLPPWIAFPGISPLDMFWRMGWGEHFMDLWAAYFQSTNRDIYMKLFPAVDEWADFYDD